MSSPREANKSSCWFLIRLKVRGYIVKIAKMCANKFSKSSRYVSSFRNPSAFKTLLTYNIYFRSESKLTWGIELVIINCTLSLSQKIMNVFLYISPYLSLRWINEEAWIEFMWFKCNTHKSHSRMLRECRIIDNVCSCSRRVFPWDAQAQAELCLISGMFY